MRDSMYEEIEENEEENREVILRAKDYTDKEKEESHSDPVNRLSHSNQGNIETIDLIESVLTPEQFKGYCLGNMLKHQLTAPFNENTNQDYDKALWYYNKYKEVF